MLWSGDLRDGINECVERCADNALMLLKDDDKCRKISKEQQERVKGNGAMNMAKYIYERFY